MPGGRESLQIRSFRVVFALERRLFKVDRFRLPFAYGVPLRAIAYAAAALGAIVLAARLPLVGALVGVLPPPLRFVAVPAGVAAVLTRVRLDGLPAHRAAGLWLTHHATRRTVVASHVDRTQLVQRVVEPLLFAPDERGPRMRPATIAGPALLRVGVPVRAEIARDTLHVAQTGDRMLRHPRGVRIAAGGRVIIAAGGAEER